MPPGEYGISVFIDGALPFNGERGFAGDFNGWDSPIVVPEGQPLVYKNLTVVRTLHLTSPVDNAAIIGYMGYPRDTYPPEEIIFRWDALAEASSYQATIKEYEEPYTYVKDVTDTSTSNVEWNVILPISEENHFYLFHLYAYSINDLLVGQLMVPYYSGYGWDYRFCISTQYQLTVEVVGSGTTDPPPDNYTVPEGDVFPVEAFPDAGWMLNHWLLDGVDVGSDNPLPVTMDADHVLRAVFSETPPVEAVIESCDPAGDQKDLFDLGETVYVTGSNYSPSTTYNFYIVADEETWSDGMAIPERVPDTVITVSSNIDGDIPPTAVWSDPQTVGKYDIVVDVNGNGQYDAGIDALDDNDIEVTAGFSAIPEFSSSLISPLFMIATLLAVVVHKSRSRKGNTR